MTAVVVIGDILCEALLVMEQGMPEYIMATYDDHQTRCSNQVEGLHYMGLAVDQILFVVVSKIPWGGISTRRSCRGTPVIRLCLGGVRGIGLRVGLPTSGLLVRRVWVRRRCPGLSRGWCSLLIA
jgi:hypothetical protein